MSDNNNVSNGPIPFFSTDDNQSSFLSGTNITNSSTTGQSTQPAQQPVQPSQQPVQPSQQANSSVTNTKPPVQDASSLFGNNKEDSFLSVFANTGTSNNNSSTFAQSNNLFYNNGIFFLLIY